MKTVKGNLLKLYLEMDEGVILHGCNCLGVMGSGIAGQIRQVFPWAYKAYMQYHDNYTLGNIIPAHDPGNPRRFIINGLTQASCGSDGAVYADRAAIESTLIKAISFKNSLDIKTPLHIPGIGVGLGGLKMLDLRIAINNAEFYTKEEIVFVEYDQ